MGLIMNVNFPIFRIFVLSDWSEEFLMFAFLWHEVNIKAKIKIMKLNLSFILFVFNLTISLQWHMEQFNIQSNV
jgi:hypothetical protein